MYLWLCADKFWLSFTFFFNDKFTQPCSASLFQESGEITVLGLVGLIPGPSVDILGFLAHRPNFFNGIIRVEEVAWEDLEDLRKNKINK